MDRPVKERLVGASILVVLVVAVVPELLSGPKSSPGIGTAAEKDLPALPAAASPTVDGSRSPTNVADPGRDIMRNVTVDLATSKPTPAEAPPTASAPEPASQKISPANSPGSSRSGPAFDTAGVSDDAGTSSAAAVSGAPGAVMPPGASPAPGVTVSGGRAPGRVPVSAPPVSGQTFAVQLGSFANSGNADKLVRQLRAQGFAIYTSEEGSGARARYRVRVGPFADRVSAQRTMAKLKTLGHSSAIVGPK